jgi:hypothetical protein
VVVAIKCDGDMVQFLSIKFGMERIWTVAGVGTFSPPPIPPGQVAFYHDLNHLIFPSQCMYLNIYVRRSVSVACLGIHHALAKTTGSRLHKSYLWPTTYFQDRSLKFFLNDLSRSIFLQVTFSLPHLGTSQVFATVQYTVEQFSFSKYFPVS